jgi:hypothetical protein
VVRLLIRGKACLPSHPSDQSVPVFTDSTQLGYQLHKYCNQLTPARRRPAIGAERAHLLAQAR